MSRSRVARVICAGFAVALATATAHAQDEPAPRPQPRPRRARPPAPPPPAPVPDETPLAGGPGAPSTAHPGSESWLLIADGGARYSVENDDLIENGKNVDDRGFLRAIEVEVHVARTSAIHAFMAGGLRELGPERFTGELDEAWAEFAGRPGQVWVPGLSLRAGKVRPALGAGNALHAHAMPETSRPYVHAAFLGRDGWRDAGFEVAWRSAPPETAGWSAFALQLVRAEDVPFFGQTRGHLPALVGSVRAQAGDGFRVAGGVSGCVGFRDRRAGDGVAALALDAAVRVRLRETGDPVHLGWRGEAILATRDDPSGPVRSAGGTTALEITRGRGAGQSLALRYDWTRDPVTPSEREWAIGLWGTLRLLPGVRLRLGYEHRERLGRGDLETIFGQCTITLPTDVDDDGPPAEPAAEGMGR